MREAIKHGDFPEIHTLLRKEKMLRCLRKTKTIVEILGGDWFLKISSLNLTCYVLNFPREKVKKEGEDEEYEREVPPVLIEGWKQNASPPLTAPSSLKPSVNKSQVAKSNEEIEEVKQVVFNEKMESPKDNVRSPEQNMTMNY